MASFQGSSEVRKIDIPVEVAFYKVVYLFFGPGVEILELVHGTVREWNGTETSNTMKHRGQ